MARPFVERVSAPCDECGSIVSRVPSRMRGKYIFCNKTCMGNYLSRERTGEKAPNWNGGRHMKDGYVFVLRHDHPAADASGYVPEHRIVAEEKIGRLLRRGEVVDHINRNRSDNRPENLRVLTRAEHARQHLARAWASHPDHLEEE